MTQDESLQKIAERLERMEKDNAENFKAIRKDIKGLKWTGKLVRWFMKNTDGRLETLKNTIKQD